MPLFLSADQIYRVLQRESPEDVLADGAPGAYFVTADNYAFAKCLESAYTSASGVYLNYFPATASDFIDDWEITCFAQISQGLALLDRQNRVISKLRARPGGINEQALKNAVTGLLPSLAPSGFELMAWHSPSGVWMIGASQLGVSTILGGKHFLEAVGPGLCAGCTNPALFGLSPTQWTELQGDAYTYEVRIYNVTLTAQQHAALDLVLTKVEAARSTHVITDNLPDSLRINGST